MRKLSEWPFVTGLAILGIVDSSYLLLFQTQKVEKIACPVFGSGCEQVSRNPIAYPAGIPDALFGVIGYSVAAATAVGIMLTRGKTQKLLASAAIAESAIALGLSAVLTYAQPAKTGAWCFWCLMSAGISTIMGITAISGARKILKSTE